MKVTKKLLAVLISVLLIAAVFAGCSASTESATTITEDTMLIAYTAESKPFIYKDENGELTGFCAELIENTFDSFKNEYKDYAFVQVEPDYVLNEDICYTDESGNEYSAIIMCGAQKNTGTTNKDYSWSENIIENNIITVVSADSSISNYNDLTDVRAGVVGAAAQTALEKNAAISNRLEAVAMDNAEAAFAALDNGEINAVVIDDFNFYTYSNYSSYKVLTGVLDTIEYGFGFAPSNNYSSGFNEAVKEMLSPDYNDGDTLTPLVEKYFGYADACVFPLDD